MNAMLTLVHYLSTRRLRRPLPEPVRGKLDYSLKSETLLRASVHRGHLRLAELLPEAAVQDDLGPQGERPRPLQGRCAEKVHPDGQFTHYYVHEMDLGVGLQVGRTDFERWKLLTEGRSNPRTPAGT